MSELSTIPINNSPAGTDSMSTVDDNIRMLGAIIKRGSVVKEATYNSGQVAIGDEAGTYLVNPTGNITSIIGGFTDGVFTLVFNNTSQYQIIAGSTITTSTINIVKGMSVTVSKASNGVFTVVDNTKVLEPRIETLETRVTATELDNTNQWLSINSHTNSLNTLTSEVGKRNQIAWGYTDGSGYYGDQYVSNMANVLLHTAINIPPGVWEVTGYSAMVFNDSVSASFNIGLIRADNTLTGVATPNVFCHFKGDGGIYMPVHFKAIVNNDTGSDQNYRLKTSAVQLAVNRQGHGLFGSSVGETTLYAIRLY